MFIVFIRTVVIYVLIIVVVRLMGKRQIGQLQPNELVVTILISNIATMAIEDVSIPLITGIMPILIFMSLEIIASWISLKSKYFRKMVSGSPRIVIRNGVVNKKELDSLRFTAEDLFEQLRVNDVFDIDEVLFAIVETNGSLSIYKKSMYQTPNLDDLKIAKEEFEPPILLVANGDIIEGNLDYVGLTKSDILNYIYTKKIKLKDIYILTYDTKKSFYLIERESKGSR